MVPSKWILAGVGVALLGACATASPPLTAPGPGAATQAGPAVIGGRAFWTDPTARYRTLTLEPVCPPTACTALYLEDRPGDSALFVLNAVDRPEGDLGNFYYTGGGTFQGAVTAIAVTGPNVSAQGTYVDTGGNPGTWTLTWDLDDDTYVLRGFTAANVLSFEVIVTLPSAGFSIVVPDRCTLLDVSG